MDERAQEEIRRSRGDADGVAGANLSDSSGTGFLASGSAIGVYGSRGAEVLDESSSIGDDFLARVCVEWETGDVTARAIRNESGAPSHRHRHVIGGGALKKQLPLFRLGLGGVLGAGEQWLSPISLRDEVRAVLWLLDTRPSGPFNLVAPAAQTNRAFTSALARHCIARATPCSLDGAAHRARPRPRRRRGPRQSACRARRADERGFNFENPTIESIVSSSFA